MRKRIKKVVWTSLPRPVRHGLRHLDRDLREWAQDPREKARKVLMTSLPKPLRHRLLGVLEVCKKERLFEWSQAPQKRMYIKRYLKLVDAGRLSWRLKIRKKQRAKACQTVHRVAFVASLGDMRVMRLAAAAQSAGLKLLLLVQHDTAHRDGMVMPELFEKVVWYYSVPRDLPLILDEIKAFDADLVHCFIQCDRNHLGAWLIANCDVPFVGDAYDMVNAQYDPEYPPFKDPTHPDYRDWLPQNRVWEKRWYENSDGLCFRSPYKKIMEKEGIYLSEKAKYLHLPEPMLEQFYERPEKNHEKKIILIWVWHEECFNNIRNLEKIWDCYNFEAILINVNNYNMEEFSGRHTIINVLNYNEYQALLRKIDFVLALPFEPHNEEYTMEGMHRCFANKYNELQENGCICFIPEYYRYENLFFKKTGYVVPYTKDMIMTYEFWEKLSLIIPEDYKKIPSFYFAGFQGQRLKKFYSKVAGTQ